MIPYHRIAGLVFNRPLLVTPNVAQTIGDYVLNRIDGIEGPRASQFAGGPAKNAAGDSQPFRSTPDGTAIITIDGELVNRGAWIGADSGLVSYEGIQFQLARAASDPKIKSILLDINSPGGEAIGAFEVATSVRAAAKIKPVTAFANGMAASAAYAIASGATRRVSIPSGETGSIGVVLMHLDLSARLHNMGVKPTLIFAGAHKVDGNPFEALPADVRARFQDEVDKFYSQFVATVATGTKLSEEAIRATEARMFTGEEAKALGLVDDVGMFDDLLAEIASANSKPVTVVITAPATKSTRQAAATNEESEMAEKTLLEKLKSLISGEPAESTAATQPPAAVPTLEVLTAENEKLKADLKAELDKRAADQADQAEKLKAAATARVAAEVTAFMKDHGSRMGMEFREIFETAYRSAKTANAESRIADLEALAKALPAAGAAERIPAGGAAADAAAARAAGDAGNPHAPHFEALKRLEKAGVKQGSPEWTAKYTEMLATVNKEFGVNRAAA